MKKYRHLKNYTHSAALDSNKVVSEFINQQEKMHSYLKEARKVNIEEAKVPISVAKFIKIGDAFG
jgi:hypothetical protein